MSNPQPNTPAARAAAAKSVVAKGRTIVIKKKIYGPGEEVPLSAEEIREWRARGFLVDPDAQEIQRGDGPTFSAKEGPVIKAA